MSVCFALREVTVRDSKGAKASWSSSTAGANKPQNTRPLALFPAKENQELLEDFVPKVEAEIKKVKAEGVLVQIGEEKMQATCKEADLSMADGKMVTSLTRLGGAYCTMCTRGQEECKDIHLVEGGFLINRSIQSITDLALSLSDPETGEVVRARGDYGTRQGVCGKPITESDLTKNIPVCHSKIRTVEWLVEFLVRYLSHQKWWTPTKPTKYTPEEKASYQAARLRLQTELYTSLAVNIGDPGDMLTGNAFKTIAADTSRAFLSSYMDEEHKEAFSDILLGLCATVKIMNSQKRLVNTEKLRQLTIETYVKLVTFFPWCAVSQSVHRILAHAWEVIQLNDGYGLGGKSEEGLEALNKYIRSIRQSGARKDSTLNNFTDTFNHLWDRSRPTIVQLAREIRRRTPKLLIMTEIESLVESLFLEEE